MADFLNQRTLTRIPASSVPASFRPRFPAEKVASGILHLGPGAFHRAHMAWYTQKAMELDGDELDWGIHGVSLKSDTTRNALRQQDCYYCLMSMENDHRELQVIGSIRGCSFLGDELAAVLQKFRDPRIRIVSLTITEKGYCHDPASGELDRNHPDIAADLRHPGKPSTAIGLLAAGLKARSDAGSGPITLLSCDNLPANGKTLNKVLKSYIRFAFPDLAAYVDDQVAFPCSMVDRIVPATSDVDRAAVASLLGLQDRLPVVAERFSQWVIEDNFPAGRPPWEKVGVDLVTDVADYETLKLCLLNGPHSACAYLGYLAGFDTVAALMQDRSFPAFLNRLVDQEVIPGLQLDPAIDCVAYKETVLKRFANRALAHSTWQIAMDGSQKLPQRLLNSARRALQKDLPLDCIALTIAAWIRYASGVDENGNPIDVRDPLADRFRKIAEAAGNDADALIEGFLAIGEVFGADLPASRRFSGAVSGAYQALMQHGALNCVKQLAEHAPACDRASDQ